MSKVTWTEMQSGGHGPWSVTSIDSGLEYKILVSASDEGAMIYIHRTSDGYEAVDMNDFMERIGAGGIMDWEMVPILTFNRKGAPCWHSIGKLLFLNSEMDEILRQCKMWRGEEKGEEDDVQ